MVAPQHPAEKIIGREAEVTAIDRFLAGVPLGPRALVLEGAAGIGKTILWKEGLSLAAARGYRILSCQPAESETQLALTGLADLLEGYVDESLPALPEPQRDALEVALLRRLPVGPPPAQRAVSVAVLGVFRSVAKLCPTLLAVDDVQWLDGSSARVLEFAARRLTDEPIGVFLTRRVADGERAPLVLDRVVPEGRHEQIAIGPLTLGALYRLIHARLGLSFPRPTLVRIHEGSGGNPFFALELARALEQRRNKPTGIEPLPVPDTIGQLVRDRIARLPARTREVLLATSALAQPTVSLVDRVLGERGLAPAELERAVRAGLIELEGERIRFTHPLVASVHYSGTPLAERRRMHRRLAGGADEPEERARHLALGSGGPDTGVAEALDHAARKARTRGAPDAAAELAELAATLTPEERPDEARRRRVDAAEDHFAAGDSERARTLLEEAIASAQPGPERADLLVRLAWVRYNADSLTEAQAHLHRALSEAGDDSRIIAWVQFMLAMVLVWRGDLPRSVVHARRALDLAERLEDPALLGPVLTAVGMTESYAGAGIRLDLMERSIAESERAEGAVVDWRPGQMLGGLQMMGDDLDAARATLLTVHSRALERGEEGSLDDHLFWMSELESRAGNFELAAQYAAQGHEIALRAGHQRNVAQLLYIRALVEAHIGRVDQARSLAEEGLAIAESLDAVFPKIRNRTALGYLELSIGNAADARRHLEAAAGQIVASGFGEPGQFQHSANLIEALVAVGELEGAKSHVEWLEERGRTLGRAWALATGARCRGLLDATRGHLDQAVRALEQALREHQQLRMPLELGRTLLVKGEIHRRARQKRLAKESLERALQIFERLGARLWAEKARGELARVGLRRSAPLELTATEGRVAELAGAGRTNRQIAEALFISPKTVEANLARIYRKLGVGSKAELAAARAAQQRPARGQPDS